MSRVLLKPGREKSVRRRHPWIFSGAIAQVEGDPQPGDTIEVCANTGEVLASAAYSPHSNIRARVWAMGATQIDAHFFDKRIEEATRARSTLQIDAFSNGLRLVHGEADGLPGVIADRYDETVVVQLLSAGADRWRDAIADALLALSGVSRVWERSDADVRSLEGLKPRTGLLRGSHLHGATVIDEHGLRFHVEVDAGHKTGFYLDQRDNRLHLRNLAREKDVLDCFSYTGGFALNALRGGAASVTAVDSSALALAAARENAALNGLPHAQWLEGDVFQMLRRMRDEGRHFDVIVLDPPKFAPTAAHAERAARAYKDINLLAFKLLRPGGQLMTYSCSGGVTLDLFQKIVAGAALDASVDARIERWLHAAPGHPVALCFPESEYLKGLLCRVAG
ncbi:MAG: class I SAM-dependent methyltransferase [Pseudomonadota bacterium]